MCNTSNAMYALVLGFKPQSDWEVQLDKIAIYTNSNMNAESTIVLPIGIHDNMYDSRWVLQIKHAFSLNLSVDVKEADNRHNDKNVTLHFNVDSIVHFIILSPQMTALKLLQ